MREEDSPLLAITNISQIDAPEYVSHDEFTTEALEPDALHCSNARSQGRKRKMSDGLEQADRPVRKYTKSILKTVYIGLMGMPVDVWLEVSALCVAPSCRR